MRGQESGNSKQGIEVEAMSHTLTRNRKCPVNGCTTRIMPDMAFCRRHWFKLSSSLRLRISDLYRRDRGSESHLMALDAARVEIEEQEAVKGSMED